jgi:isoquinoline 1-oxidoreductase alpha subunit
MPKYIMTVNGPRRVIEADPDTPLLWILRDTLGLTGTKYGCGEGLCGACTVHIDGIAERSCLVTLEEASGKAITTIEGLAADKNNLIIRTWIDLEVSQCGYCQPGVIMNLSALLQSTPRPTREQVSRAMTGVLCRCGTYQRIRQAVEKIVSEG